MIPIIIMSLLLLLHQKEKGVGIEYAVIEIKLICGKEKSYILLHNA